MSDGKKPFWSSVPGVVTGVAGVVSAIVGLFGVSTQLGWIGGDDGAASSSNGVPTTTVSTVFGATTTSSVAAARAGEFSVDPSSVTFEPLKAREAVVRVQNTGDVPLTMRRPTVSGTGAASFEAADVTCVSSTLAPGRSCEIKVTFTATQAGDYAAALVVTASNVPRAVEVELEGKKTLLG